MLHRLAHGEADMIEPTAGTINRTHPNYRLKGAALAALGSAVAYSRRSTSETDQKVVGHVREYGTINNATVQRFFDLDVYKARDVLQDLVGRELLVRVSEQTRGVAMNTAPAQNSQRRNPRRKRSQQLEDDDTFPLG